MKKYKTLRMAISLSNLIAVLTMAISVLFSMIYLSADMGGMAIGSFVFGCLSALMWMVIGGIIEVLIDIAQTSFTTASLLTQMAAKNKPKGK